MDSQNTVSLIRQCGEIFSKGLGNEPAKYHIKEAFASWFTKNHSMNHATTETLFKNCGEIFGEGLNINEPAKNTIQNAISEAINNFSDKLIHEVLDRDRPNITIGRGAVGAGDSDLSPWRYGGFSWDEIKASDQFTKNLATESLKGCYEGLSYGSSWVELGKGIAQGGIIGGVRAITGVCIGGSMDRVQDNIRGENVCNNTFEEVYRCGPSQMCIGSSEAGTGVCIGDTNFVSSLGNSNH